MIVDEFPFEPAAKDLIASLRLFVGLAHPMVGEKCVGQWWNAFDIH